MSVAWMTRPADDARATRLPPVRATAVIAPVPPHAHSTQHSSPCMSDADYSMLLEILDRAHAILRESPSSDRSLSFLRLLAAYDQILLRHDMAPKHDTAVFQWLVTLNIQTEEDTRIQHEAEHRTGQHRTASEARAREYPHWKQKLDQLYAAGEARRQALRQEFEAAERQRQRAQAGLPAGVPASHLHDRELSIDSLSSSAASPFPSPHVSFAKHAAPPAARGGPTNLRPLASSLSGSRNNRRGKAGPPSRLDSSELSSSGNSDGEMDEKYDDSPTNKADSPTGDDPLDDSADADAREEQAFLDLVHAKSRAEQSEATLQRQRVHAMFQAWRAYSRPRYELLPRIHAKQRERAAVTIRDIFRHWHETGSLLHRLRTYERQHAHATLRHLLRFWFHEAQLRQVFKSKQHHTHVGVAVQLWRLWLQKRAYRTHLMLQADRMKRILDWKHGVRRWAQFARGAKRTQRKLWQMHERRQRDTTAAMWSAWRSALAVERQDAVARKQHLLGLRQHQCLIHWASWTRLLHSPRHSAILTVQQFHILWRWLSHTFGNGYDPLRIIWLSKINYQKANTALPSIHEQEMERQRRQQQQHSDERPLTPPLPNPTTHPFVAGPPVHTSFAATATAPFAHAPHDDSADFSHTLPTVTFFVPATPATSAGPPVPPVLGSPVSSFELAAAPHVDSALPMQHAILELLNRSLTFRRHKLAPLLSMIQLWSRWYLKHLFSHWRTNIRIKKANRQAQQKAQQEIALMETAKEQRAIQVHSYGLLQRALERWQDSFHKSTYYSLLLKNFYARQARRMVSEQYVLWKFSFVAARALKLFRLRRGIRCFTGHLQAAHRTQRKYGIVQFTRNRNLLSSVWHHWRLQQQHERDTKFGMLSMLWQRWKSNFITTLERRQEEHDASTYYSLKLLLRSLLTWRALSITLSIASKYTHKAVHHHHQQLSHRHIAWWVNWKRYKHETKRMMEFAQRKHQRELTGAAVQLWLENARASSSRHKKFRDCKQYVCNKHLAYAALRTWQYSLRMRYTYQRVVLNGARRSQQRAWHLWLACIRAKNVRYEQLESEVILRRDWNRMGGLFHKWLQCSRDIRKAHRLGRHCETVWYYSLIKRLFQGWRHVAIDVHQQQMQQAAQAKEDAWYRFRTLGCLRRWRNIIKQKKRYALIIHNTRAQLEGKYQLARWYRLWRTHFKQERCCRGFLARHHSFYLLSAHWATWREQHKVVREQKRKIRIVASKQCARVLPGWWQRWAGAFVAFSKRRRVVLGSICNKLRLKAMRQAMVEWKLFRHESRLRVEAKSLQRRTLLAKFYREWSALSAHHRRAHRLEDWANSIFSRRTCARVLSVWRERLRSEQIHTLFLLKKCFLVWVRYKRKQAEQKRVAQEFKDNSRARRLNFAWNAWRRFGAVHFRKQSRKLKDRMRKADTINMHDRVMLWSHWTQARSEARESIAAVGKRNKAGCMARAFALWFDLFQQEQWGRSLRQHASKAFRQSALTRVVARWVQRTKITAKLNTMLKQAQSQQRGNLLARTYANWRRAKLAGDVRAAAAVHRFQRPRLLRLYSSWKASTGRSSAVLHIHRNYLHRTLQTWRANARESFFDRVSLPLAIAHRARQLSKVALHHWFKYRIVHHAAVALRPVVNMRLKEEAMQHWLAVQRMQRRVDEFTERVARTSLKRHRRRFVRIWRARVAQRTQYVENAERIYMHALHRLLSSSYRHWRRRMHTRYLMTQQGDDFFHSHTCPQILRAVWTTWRRHYTISAENSAIQERGAAHEHGRTDARKRRASFAHWHEVARYAAGVQHASRTLRARRVLRIQAKLFFTWNFLSRRRVSVQRMDRLHRLLSSRHAFLTWVVCIETIKKCMVVHRCHLLHVQKAHLAHWWTQLKVKQRNRAEVQLLHSRMRLASTHGAGRWERAKALLVPVMKAWMSPESSVRFYLQMWRAYNKHCRSFRDADDLAVRHHLRHVLTPSTWREWKQAIVISQQNKRAIAAHKSMAQQRFLMQLRRMLLRKARRTAQVQQATQHRRRVQLGYAWSLWKADALYLQEQRVRGECACACARSLPAACSALSSFSRGLLCCV